MPSVDTARPYLGRKQGLERRHFTARPGRTYSLTEMAELLNVHRKTLERRVHRNNGTAPPAFQPSGPGTPWRFLETSYFHWLDEKEGHND